MEFKDVWINKVDGQDDVLAEDINSIAQEVIRLESDKADEKNVGNLSELETVNKTSIVAAINGVNKKIGTEIFYGVCDDSIDTMKKTVAVDNYEYQLKDGNVVIIKFKNGLRNNLRSEEQQTLNVNNTGNISIGLNGVDDLGYNDNKEEITSIGGILAFSYSEENEQYVMISPDYVSRASHSESCAEVGNIGHLSTTDKTSIVGAINELVENGELYKNGELPIALEFVNGTINNTTGNTGGIGTQTTSLITENLYPVILNTGLAISPNIPENTNKEITVIVFEYRGDNSFIGRVSLGAVKSKKHFVFDENCAYYRLRVAYSDGSEITPQEGKEYVDVGIISQLNKNIGSLSQLATANKTSLVDAINELSRAILQTGGNV